MKLLKLAICLLLLGGLSASCTKEDHSDCYNTYRLALRYNGDGNDDIFSQKINSVDMYVFDVNSVCVSQARLSQADIQAQETVLPPLREGEYRIVCIGNAYNTKVQGLDSKNMNNMTFAARSYLNGEKVSGNDSLYWSAINYTIQPYSEYKMEETKTSYFSSSHYDILVEVVNAPDVLCADPVIELVGVSPLTNFNNEAQGQPADYMLDAVISQGNNITAKCNIMRHTNHEDVYLKISSQDGSIIHQVNFAEHISRYSSYINTSLNECLIPFKVEFGDSKFDIKIEVPSWVIENVTPEF